MESLKNIDLSRLIGQDVGSSTLLEEIARGSMGAVFIGYQKTLKRQIAIKILPKAIITDLTSKIFQQEAELAAKLSHPNIIPVYEVGDTGDFLFLAMQLVKGEPLSEHIQMAHHFGNRCHTRTMVHCLESHNIRGPNRLCRHTNQEHNSYP